MTHFSPIRIATLALFAGLSLLFPAHAQVTISEISAAQSDRLLQRPPGAPPKLGSLPAWHELDFAAPAWWGSGPGPIGFGYTQATNVQSVVRNKTPVVYLRREFSASAGQAASAQALELLIDYDDGFIAYLNGVEVARRNTGAAGSFAWHDQPAFNQKLAGTAETISLGSANGRLRTGVNVLAIQVHNSAEENGQLFCSATLRLGGAAPQNLVVPADTWRWFAGTHEPSGGLYDGSDFAAAIALGPNWTQLDYADSAWTLAPGALGFEGATGYGGQLGTNLITMRNAVWSLYLRREFTLTQAQFDAITATSLTVDWDDGYVLYLNGYELSRANLPGAAGSFVAYNQAASGHGARFENNVDNGAATVAGIAVPRNLLRVGRNVLSAQIHNDTIGSSDLLLDVRFSATSGGSTLTFVTLGSQWRYRLGNTEFATPAPASTELIAPEFLDWIELKNSGATPMNIGGWTLTDDPAMPMKWTFPAGTTIPANGFHVVAASGRDIPVSFSGGLLHTNFSLSGAGEYLALRDGGGALRSELAIVPDQDPFHTWGIDAASGEYRFLDRGTPGTANIAGTANDVASEVEFSQPTGFHAAGVTVALSTATSGAAIRYTLDGSEPTVASTLYTTPFNPTQRQTTGPGAGTILREMFQWSAGTTITPPVFRASYANATPTTSQLLQGFETPTGIGENYTHRVRGYIHAPQTGNYQFWIATDDDGELWLSSNDNQANKQRIAHITGNWASPREWTKHATQVSALIPLVAGQRYYVEAYQSEGGGGDNCAVGWSGPGLPSGISVIEARYLSPPATLPPGTTQPPGYGVVRAKAFAAGKLPSETRTRNYVVGLDARLATVPAFFLSGPASETFYSPNGIFAQVGGGWPTGSWTVNDPLNDYNFAVMSGDAFERPAALEIVNPGNQLVERTTAGVRFAGSPWSRPQYQLGGTEANSWNSGEHNKPQMNMFFRGEYGISRFTKDGFFPTSRLNEWDEWRLRAGKNDAYNPFIIDEWMRRTFAATGAPAPQGTFATVFVNGHFKSYFNPTERVRESFFQEFYGSGNEWDINYIGVWEGGDGTAYGQMDSFFRNTDFTSLANYNTGAAYWDMANVADYVIVNGWGATQDWPHNNYAFARERIAGSKWRFSMWDAEGAMGRFGQANTHNTFENELHLSSASSPASEGTTAALVFRRAHQNAEFKMLFADRLQKHFFNGGVMTRANMNARWNGMRAIVEPLVNAVFGGGYNNGNWDAWANREATFLAQARTAGLWPATLAPGVAPFGGTIGSGGFVTMTNPNTGGTIIFTTNGADPRAVGGAVQGTSYGGPIAVSSPVTLKARIRSAAGEWSPLIEADFAPPPQRILITELNYNPPGSEDLTEFIELTNVSNQSASLNGAHFTAGVGFTFENVALAAGQSIVLVKDAAAFAAAYPGVAIGGVFTGSLANEGETITLVDIAENQILTLTYGDENIAGWPADADGSGRTLVLRRQFAAATNPAMPASWRTSSANGGNPGAADSTVFSGNAMADLDGDGHNALVEHALGTNDANAASRPLLEAARDEFGRVTLRFARSIAADDVVVDALESSDLSTWQMGVLETEVAEGTNSIRATWRSNGAGPSVFLRLRVRMQ